METEFINVLKFDFYTDKIQAYHEIAQRTMNALLQLRAYKAIDDDEFKKNMDFFTNFYVTFMEEFNNINYKYTNMMGQIFDINVGGDERTAVLNNYISEKKIEQFNEEMDAFEENYFTMVDTVVSILDELSLAKMFLLDFDLLSVIEDEFNDAYNIIEFIESTYGKFEDTIEGDF